MLPLGHLSVAYLISQIPRLKRQSLKTDEVLFILFCGVVFDLDSFIPSFLSLPAWFNHHFFFTHTLLFGFFYFLMLYLIFRKRFSSLTFLLAALAMFSHLVLDDLPLLSKLINLPLQEDARPQIFWFYPFDPRREIEIKRLSALYGNAPFYQSGLSGILEYYLFEAKKILFLEILLSFIALRIFYKNRSGR